VGGCVAGLNGGPGICVGEGAEAAPRVAILLGTFNGARFLRSQLESIERQGFTNWRLFASDDGSRDETWEILREFQSRQSPGKVILKQGPRSGFVGNFLSLVCDDDIDATYYAFSDQDDIWYPDKLTRALGRLGVIPASRPALYCSRTQLIDEAGKAIGFSPLFSRRPSFTNALVQSLAGGNTMVFNEGARQILRDAGAGVSVPAHDWWIYQAVTSAGGDVLYDHSPSVCYRVHAANAIGSNHTFRSRMRRIKMMYNGRLRSWSNQNIQALERIRHRMTPDSRRTLDLFRKARVQPVVPRSVGLARSGIHRQTALGNIGLIVAALTGMI
jgi:glycosyltransferase involved in cell wall biosynthesis